MISSLMELLFCSEKQRLKKIKKKGSDRGYLGLRVVVVQVVVGAVVRVAGFVQQLDGQRSAERLGHKRMLQHRTRRDQKSLLACIYLCFVSEQQTFILKNWNFKT